MQSRIEDLREAGGEVLAISVDPADTTREKLGSQGFDFSLLSDPELETIDAYGVRHPKGGMGGHDVARPAVFVIDRGGKVVWRDLTDNWRIRVRPGRVLEQLKAIP